MWQNGHSDIKLAGELESFQQRIFPPKSRKRLLAKVEHAITPGMPSGIRKNAHLKRLDTPKSFISLVFNRVNAIKSAAKAALSGWITGSLRLAPSRPLLGSVSEARQCVAKRREASREATSASDEVARGRLVPLEGFWITFPARNKRHEGVVLLWARDFTSGCQISRLLVCDGWK